MRFWDPVKKEGKGTILTSAPVTTTTMITLWINEVNFNVDNIEFLINKTFDPLLTFHRRAIIMRTKLPSRNKVLKTLLGSKWGINRETTFTTYKIITNICT